VALHPARLELAIGRPSDHPLPDRPDDRSRGIRSSRRQALLLRVDAARQSAAPEQAAAGSRREPSPRPV